MCRQFLLASVGALAITSAAFAADLAAPPPPPPVPAFTWSGVYLGAQIGYAWGKDNVDWNGSSNALNGVYGEYDQGPQGVVGGAHVGWNIQPNSWFVFGVEATVDGASIRKSVTTPLADSLGGVYGSMSTDSNQSVQGSVRGRMGVAFDRVLVYGMGGVAVTSFTTNYYDTTGFFTAYPGASATISNTRAGFIFGGGLEYAIDNNWSVRAEYSYSNFGHVTDYPFLNPNINVFGYFAANHSLDESKVQVGFSYKFDGMMVPPPPAPLEPQIIKR